MRGSITVRQVTYVYGSKIRGSRENGNAIGFQELPIHAFVKTLPAKSLILSNQPQQLFSISKRPPVFTQYQIDVAQKRRCGHRYFVWYNTLYHDGTPNTESMPQGATAIFNDSWGTIFDLGSCRDDINFYWP
jgi:hypothetical protein